MSYIPAMRNWSLKFQKLIYNSIENIIHTYKPNKICIRFICGKQQNTNEGNQRIEIFFHAYKLKDSILLKCQCFPTWYIDSMQFNSKSQENILHTPTN